MKESIFKSYDIRGLFGEDLTVEIARKIGRAFVVFLKSKNYPCETIVVGRDNRWHSPALFDALAEGMTEQGANVVDLGEISTPMSYFGNGFLGADAGVMITASHLPEEHNGFKLSRRNAIPISGANGIKDIEKLVAENAFGAPALVKGKISQADISEQYCEFIRKEADIKKEIEIVADCGFAMGIAESKVFEGLPIKVTKLYGDIADKANLAEPIHEVNPLDTDNMKDLQKAVIDGKGKYAFGVAFDADADRCGFVDENGRIIPMDISAALIAEAVLERRNGAEIGYDLRSSWAVDETIRHANGKPFRTRVGHAYIKEQMRERSAEFVGELSGHYYFRTQPRDGADVYGESSALAVIYLANKLSKSGKPLSKLVEPIQRYFASGEINSGLDNKEQASAAIERIKEKYRSDAWINELDGISVDLQDWWFNVRCSNTEPLLRLNLESKISAEDMRKKVAELKTLIGGDWEIEAKKKAAKKAEEAAKKLQK